MKLIRLIREACESSPDRNQRQASPKNMAGFPPHANLSHETSLSRRMALW